MRIYLFLLLCFSLTSYSQSLQELDTKITDVTVFLQSAQITRTGNVTIPSGESTVVIEKLSPYMDDKSVQVKADGNFTILSVKHKLDYLSEREKSSETKNLQEEAEELGTEIEEQNARLSVLSEKESLLDKNKNLNGETNGTNLVQLKQAIEFYDKELSEIKKDYIQTRKKIEDLTEQLNKVESQIADIRNQENLPSGKLEIKVESDDSTAGQFNISYLVGNAGWYPNYDLRVDNINNPLNLEYKADVYQNTGVDWNNVKLKFSNGNPNQSGVAPELETWYLNYARNSRFQTSIYDRINPDVKTVTGKVMDEEGLPLPGVNVIVKGSTVGTQTDFDGNYEITLPNNAKYLVYSFIGMETREIPISQTQINITLIADATSLEEVVVTGYGNDLNNSNSGLKIRGVSSLKQAKKIETTTIKNQTTVEFEVERLYSVPTTGEILSVDLKEFEIETEYEYYAVPKLESDAFLIAQITDWDKYNLLEGEANLFFENSYVGRTVLDARSLSDTLSISLGRDRNILIGREKIDEFSKKRTLGSNKIETREFRVIVRNKKSEPVEITIYDQIPVSVINEIEVEEIELSNGQLNEKTGEVVWHLNLMPEEQKELILKYEVKYPKSENLILE